MSACKFELTIFDHYSVYHSMLNQLSKVTGQPRNEDMMNQLTLNDVQYYKSDLCFTLHPVLYATANFSICLETVYPGISLNEVCQFLSAKALKDIEVAEKRIQAAISANQIYLNKSEARIAADRFKQYNERLKLAASNISASNKEIDKIKR